MNNKGNIIQSLTSLRMFAALGVFVSHLGLLSQSSIGVFNTAAKYFFNGYIGVTFFYILSGFIINYSFINHVKKEAFSNKDFIVYRIARIFPVHIVALLCFILYLCMVRWVMVLVRKCLFQMCFWCSHLSQFRIIIFLLTPFHGVSHVRCFSTFHSAS